MTTLLKKDKDGLVLSLQNHYRKRPFFSSPCLTSNAWAPEREISWKTDPRRKMSFCLYCVASELCLRLCQVKCSSLKRNLCSVTDREPCIPKVPGSVLGHPTSGAEEPASDLAELLPVSVAQSLVGSGCFLEKQCGNLCHWECISEKA